MENIIFSVYEQLDRQIGFNLKHIISSNKIKNKMLLEYGNEAFLDPLKKTFPVINPNTGCLDCSLIYASKIRSYVLSKIEETNENYYDNILKKANDLYKKCNCDNYLLIETQDVSSKSYIHLSKFETIFDINDTDFNKILKITNFLETK